LSLHASDGQGRHAATLVDAARLLLMKLVVLLLHKSLALSRRKLG
jgi:hypothetical protein